VKVLLTGATGFVGGHLLQRLLAEGHAVRALVRNPQKPNQFPAENVTLIQGDVADGAGLTEGLKDCDAVIHLVGIIVEDGKATFERVHETGTRNVVEAAKRNDVARFIQMSAIGARADGVAPYQTTKWKAEELVRQSGIPYCILRPSLIFGPGDGFVSQMLDVMRKAPLFRPVPGDGMPRFRPVFIDDVTACFTRALTVEAATHQTIELGGADELPLNDVLTEIARHAGIRKRPAHVPLSFMFLAAVIAQRLPGRPPVTVDQLRMLREGSTCDIGAMKQILGVEPCGFGEGLSTYLFPTKT
jgi:NADH dehydrogenase